MLVNTNPIRLAIARHNDYPPPPDVNPIRKTFGNKIDDHQEKYESGELSTPQELYRRNLIIGLAVTTLAAVGVVIAGTMYVKYEALKFVAVPLVGVVAYGLYTIYNLRPDFQHPRVRETHIPLIASMSFHEIAEKYTVDEVIGFRLLDSSSNPAADALYFIFKRNAGLYNAMKTQVETLSETVEADYSTATRWDKIMWWINQISSLFTRVRFENAARELEGEKKEKQTFLGNLAAGGARLAGQVIADAESRAADRDYHKNTAGPQAIREANLLQIDNAKNEAITKLDTAFATFKKPVEAHTHPMYPPGYQQQQQPPQVGNDSTAAPAYVAHQPSAPPQQHIPAIVVVVGDTAPA